VTDDELILEYIELSPHRGGLDEVRIKGRGVRVWALVGHAGGPDVGGDIDIIAAHYDLPRDAVLAARAYYRRHRAVLNNRFLANTPEMFDAATLVGNAVEAADYWPIRN
jgi:uncharacterized protein (DUF433 family)